MTQAKLVVFDLDGTLIDADCAQDWMHFLQDNKWPNIHSPLRICSRIMLDYNGGSMNMRSYMRYWLQPIMGYAISHIDKLATEFAHQKMFPQIYPEALAKVQAHQQAGDIVVIISASPSIVVKPIASLFGITNVISIEAIVKDNRLTGQFIEPFSFKEGKVLRLHQWLDTRSMEKTKLHTMYSDSINDLPLLFEAQYPIVVNGDTRLINMAREKRWQKITWTCA